MRGITYVCLMLLLCTLGVQGVDKTKLHHHLHKLLDHSKHHVQHKKVDIEDPKNINLAEIKEEVFADASTAPTPATTTGVSTSTGVTDTSAILDSYRDLEERVQNLEAGGVQRRVQAGDAIAAAKAQAEAMIKAALQDVANGAQAQAMAEALAAAQQAQQEQAEAANNGGGNGGESGGGGGGGGATVASTGGGAGTDTGIGGGGDGSGIGNSESGVCCENAIDPAARAAQVQNAQDIAAMAAKIASLENVIAGLGSGAAGGGGVSSSGIDSGDNGNTINPTGAPASSGPDGESVTNPTTTPTPTVTPYSSSATGGGGLIEDDTSSTALSTVVDPDVVEEERKAHAAATEALLRKLDLNDKLNLDPKVIKQSQKLVDDLGDNHADVMDQLAKDCAEPTCPVPGGVVVPTTS